MIGKAKPKSATIFLATCYSGLSRGKEALIASARGIVVTPKPQSIPSGFTVLSAASGQPIRINKQFRVLRVALKSG